MYIEISAKVTISGWWLSPTPLTNMISSQYMEKNPNVPNHQPDNL